MIAFLNDECWYNAPENFTHQEKRNMKRVLSLTAVTILFSAVALANIANPNDPSRNGKKNSVETTMMIHLRQDAREAKLVIPKNQLRQLRAQLDELDGEQNTAAVTTGGITRVQTIVSGMFLSLAVVFGGMWFVRSGKNAKGSARTLAVVTIAACVGSAVTIVFANAGPPPEARSITGKMFSQAVHLYGFGSGRIKLETANDGDYIDLIVPDPKTSPSPEE